MPDSTSSNPCCQEYIAQINQLTQQLEENDKQLEDVTNKLQQVQRLYDRSTQYATDLQDQIDRLNLELQEFHRTNVLDGDVHVPDVAKPKSEVSVVHTGTQTEYNDTDVQCVHKNTDIGTQAVCGTELGARPSQFTDPQGSSAKNEVQMHSPGDSTELMAAWAPSNEDPEEGEIPQEKQSIADSLREAAEEAQQLTGFVYDQSTGLYYDHTSGYYYDAEKSLYYEPYSGTYYYFDTTKNTYEFHSKADFSNYSQEAYARYYKNVTGQKLKKKKKDKEKKTKKETSEKSSKKVRRKKRKKTEDNSDDGSDEDSSRSKKRRKKHKKEKYHKKEKHKKHKKAHKHSKHHHRKPLRDNIDKNVVSDSTEKVELTADTKISPLHDTEYVTSIPSDPDYKHDEPNKHTSSVTSVVDTNTSDHETLPSRSPENNICSETVKTEQHETASTNSLSDGEIESEYSTPTDIHVQTDTATKILNTDDICMDFEEGEVIASSSNEEISITDSDTQSSSSEEIEESSTSSSEDEDDIQEISARNYPPCIRAIVKESEELDKGCLHIITYSGATIGRDKELKHSILLTDVQISKMHCDIKYNEELRRYEVMDHASQNGTFVNGHRLAQPKVLSEPYPLSHNDQLTIGGTTLEIHVHPGTQTCDGCEPGLVREKVQSEDSKESEKLGIASKAEKEKLRRQQLKQIKKKYGLAREDFIQTNPHNPAYKDKAAERRRVVGSDNPHQKDDVPASVHRAISTENKGHKLLAKMGWKTGDSLGKSQTGIMEPIQVQFRTNQSAGLGSYGAHSASLDHVADAESKKNWIKAQKRFHNLDKMPNVQTDNSTKPGTPGKIQFSLGQTITPEEHKQQNPDLTFKSQGHGQLSCSVKLKHESGGRLEHSACPEHTRTKITTTSTTVGPIKWAKGRTKVGQKVVASHNVTDVFGQESSDDEDPG